MAVLEILVCISQNITSATNKVPYSTVPQNSPRTYAILRAFRYKIEQTPIKMQCLNEKPTLFLFGNK